MKSVDQEYKIYKSWGNHGLFHPMENLQEAQENLVDQHGDGPVLLPLYHENKRANKNIINVRLNNDGTFRTAEWLEDDARIIFL